MRGVSRAIGNEAVFLVQNGFNTGTDPYGQQWATKVFRDGNRPLTGPTGKLRDGWRLVYAGQDAAIIANAVPYARFQSGTGIYGPTGQPIVPKHGDALKLTIGRGMLLGRTRAANGRFVSGGRTGGKFLFFRSVRGAPARRMVPREGFMPLSWDRAITVAAREYLQRRFNDQ